MRIDPNTVLNLVSDVLAPASASESPPVTGPLMSLGMFVFELRSVTFDQIQQQLSWRHASSSRVGQRPALQFVGQDTETVTIPGTLYPELTGGEYDLARLRELGDAGEAYALIDGTGLLYGMFVLTDLQITRSVLFADGAARKIEFSLTLKRADDEASE